MKQEKLRSARNALCFERSTHLHKVFLAACTCFILAGRTAWNRWVSYFDLVHVSRLKPAGLRMRTAAAFSFEEGYGQQYFLGPFL